MTDPQTTSAAPPQEELDLDAKMSERFEALPSIVQDAILSSDLEKNLRALANTHQLHLDQWDALQNEVMLAMLGFQAIDALADNIASEVHVPADTARALAADISRIIFEPIRQELERGLGAPQAKEEHLDEIEQVRQTMLAAEKKLAVAPSTPPAPKPSGSVTLGPADGAYKPGETSSARADIKDDPYREKP